MTPAPPPDAVPGDGDTDVRVVQLTAPSRDEAERIGRLAVDRHLAACAQVWGPVSSTYRWAGAVESAAEWACALKTTAGVVAELVALVAAEHDYEVPEVLVLPVTGGHAAYLAWVVAEVGPQR